MDRKLKKNANGLKRVAKRAVDKDDNLQNLIVNQCQRPSPRNRTPAQERLENLQLKLRIGRITKEKHAPKTVTKNATNSASVNSNRINQMPTTPATTTATSTALSNFSFASQTPIAVAASTASSSNSRRSLPANPFAKPSESTNKSGVRNAWAKPKALANASNRLHNNRPLISANSRLALLQETLQQTQRDNDNNNNNELPTNTTTNISNADDEIDPMEIDDMDIDADWMEKQTTAVDAAADVMPLDLSFSKTDANEANKANIELPKRMLDHMYYVLDTNILMDDLTFVDNLSRLALGDSKGSMLFIPYVVIKELDGLKVRRGGDNGQRRTAAIRAIRYLNDKFDKSLKIQGQSALEDAEHLIDVACGDDSIVNCCVQLREQVPKLMLLTNDANLQLKAKTSSITVSSGSDLLALHHKDFAALPS